MWIWEQTAIISLYSTDWLVFITETECVYCAVRTGYLNKIYVRQHVTVTSRTRANSGILPNTIALSEIRQHVLENCIYFVFRSLIFFLLLRTTCSSLPIIPHCSRPNSTLPPVYFSRRTSGHSQSTLQKIIIINIVSFATFPCRYSCLSLYAVTLSYSKCRTCPCSWPHHRQFTALDSVPCLAWVQLFIGCSPPPNSTCVWGFAWSSRQVKVAGNRGGLQNLHCFSARILNKEEGKRSVLDGRSAASIPGQ